MSDRWKMAIEFSAFLRSSSRSSYDPMQLLGALIGVLTPFSLILAISTTLQAEPKEPPSAGATSAAKSGDLVGWFASQLKGATPPLPKDEILADKEIVDAQETLWAAYKAAAISLGWDKEISPTAVCPKLPSIEEFSKLPPDQRPKLPAFQASEIQCGQETMPYLLFSRGDRPAKGFPLFIQTHGGGGTGDKLPNPHAWEVNTSDWKNQVPVCLFLFPEGLYFVPRMANDNKGRWWMKHNHIAFDYLIRRAILFRHADPDRIYMTGISEGAYGTEAMTPFWADRFAGGCAMAGGAGGGERFYNLRNTAYRNDSGESDTMFDRIKLAHQAHDYLDALKKDDPDGYDHMLAVQPGKGHGINYAPGPAWISTKIRNTRPDKLCWFNFALDGERRTDFSWLALAKAPARDTLIIARADRSNNSITVSASINPEDAKNEPSVYNTSTPPPVGNRIPYTGNSLIIRLDDKLLDLNKPVAVIVNGKEVFMGKVERNLTNMANDIVRFGDPGRIFPAQIKIEL